MNAAETSASATGAFAGLAADPQTGPAAGSAAQAAGQALGDAANAIGQNGALVSWANYFQALAILFLIVALLAVLLWFVKRKGGLNVLTKQGDLALESRLPLGPKKSLVVVRFLNKKVLLGVTDQRITMLTELHTDEDDEPGPKPAADFKAFLDETDLPPK